MSVAEMTGANRGLGYATAIERVPAGYDVVAIMRDKAAGDELRRVAWREMLSLPKVSLIDGRVQLSDGTWVDLGRKHSDEEFCFRFSSLFRPKEK
jgi:NAD(P)-dependent dehydrogenase (short-subunit alcohol dehydrogenase family)